MLCGVDNFLWAAGTKMLVDAKDRHRFSNLTAPTSDMTWLFKRIESRTSDGSTSMVTESSYDLGVVFDRAKESLQEVTG